MSTDVSEEHIACKWQAEPLRLPHFLDNRFAEGDELVSFTSGPPFTPRKIPAYPLEPESTPGP
jgi:hypothetical protein